MSPDPTQSDETAGLERHHHRRLECYRASRSVAPSPWRLMFDVLISLMHRDGDGETHAPVGRHDKPP